MERRRILQLECGAPRVHAHIYLDLFYILCTTDCKSQILPSSLISTISHSHLNSTTRLQPLSEFPRRASCHLPIFPQLGSPHCARVLMVEGIISVIQNPITPGESRVLAWREEECVNTTGRGILRPGNGGQIPILSAENSHSS